jgi:hypothetical protein
MPLVGITLKVAIADPLLAEKNSTSQPSTLRINISLDVFNYICNHNLSITHVSTNENEYFH